MAYKPIADREMPAAHHEIAWDGRDDGDRSSVGEVSCDMLLSPEQ